MGGGCSSIFLYILAYSSCLSLFCLDFIYSVFFSSYSFVYLGFLFCFVLFYLFLLCIYPFFCVLALIIFYLRFGPLASFLLVAVIIFFYVRTHVHTRTIHQNQLNIQRSAVKMVQSSAGLRYVWKILNSKPINSRGEKRKRRPKKEI